MNAPETVKLHTRPGGTYTPGRFREEAIAFLRTFMNEQDFGTIMRSAEGQERPCVAARIYLSPANWEKYVWIEQHGSLDGFSAREE